MMDFFDYFEEQSRIAVQEKKSNEAAEINIWGSEIYQEICDLQARGVLISPNEVELSSVPPEIVIIGQSRDTK